jgi:hypothetical protein
MCKLKHSTNDNIISNYNIQNLITENIDQLLEDLRNALEKKMSYLSGFFFIFCIVYYLIIFLLLLEQELDSNIDRRIVEVRNQIDLKVESLKLEIEKTRDKLFGKLDLIKNRIKTYSNSN